MATIHHNSETQTTSVPTIEFFSLQVTKHKLDAFLVSASPTGCWSQREVLSYSSCSTAFNKTKLLPEHDWIWYEKYVCANYGLLHQFCAPEEIAPHTLNSVYKYKMWWWCEEYGLYVRRNDRKEKASRPPSGWVSTIWFPVNWNHIHLLLLHHFHH